MRSRRRRIVGGPDAAHGAVQEAFARAARGRLSFRGDGSHEGWVWRTVVNAVRSALRDLPPHHLLLHEFTDDPASGSGSSSCRSEPLGSEKDL